MKAHEVLEKAAERLCSRTANRQVAITDDDGDYIVDISDELAAMMRHEAQLSSGGICIGQGRHLLSIAEKITGDEAE